MTDSKYNLSEKQKRLVLEYLSNGFDKQAAALSVGYKEIAGIRAFKHPAVINYLDKKPMAAQLQTQLTYELKLTKLKQIIDSCVPDNCEFILPDHAAAAIKAINEANRMQGHHAATKMVTANINVDADIEQVSAVMVELIKKYERDY